MRKAGKRFAACLSAILLASGLFAAGAAAESATQEDFQKANGVQKAYYQDVYVPAYHQYNAYLSDLAQQIAERRIDSAKLPAVRDLLVKLVAQRKAFYGDRETPGTSRYEVPKARNAMYKAADEDKQYDLAIRHCGDLSYLVHQRVDVMDKAMREIDALLGNGSEKPDDGRLKATVVFDASDSWGDGGFSFTIKIVNQGNAKLEMKTLAFDLSGCRITSVWAGGVGGAVTSQVQGDRVTLAPMNGFQLGFACEPGGTILLCGSASGSNKNLRLANFTLNGQSVDWSLVR